MNTNVADEKPFAPVKKEAAPEALLPVLEHVDKIFGFIPNLMGTLANAPAAAKGYRGIKDRRAPRPQPLAYSQIAARVVKS